MSAAPDSRLQQARDRRSWLFAPVILLGVIFGPFKSSAGELIQHAALVPEISACDKRLEGIHVTSLDGGIGLIKKVVLASPHPRTVSVHSKNPYASLLPPVSRDTLVKKLALGSGEMQGSLNALAVLRARLLPGALFLVQLSPPRQKMIEQQDNEPTHNSRANMRKKWYDVFTHIIAGACGSLTVIIGQRLLTPNDQSSATRRTGRNDCNHDAPAGFAAAYG